MNNLRIIPERFSKELCEVSRTYGMKTIGSMYKALNKSNKHARWFCGSDSYIRTSKLLKELDSYLSNQ